MKKTHAINILGGTNRAAAEAVGITVQAVSAWPTMLPATIADRVEAAYYRINGQRVPDEDANSEQYAIEIGAGS